MARLLKKPVKQRLSKADAAGVAYMKLQMQGSLTIPVAADYLGVHKYTLREYVDEGLIASFVVGNRHRIAEDTLRRVKQLLVEHGSLAKAFKQTPPDGDEYA